MKLIIIESPNKIKKLQSILPKDYVILASIGHMFDLPKKELGIDLKNFDTNLILDQSKSDILQNIKREADDAEIIYLASDADREGSAISKNIFDSLPKENQKKCKRLLINAITKEAVEQAIKNPTVLDDNLSDAQKGRRVTDRLVGYGISPIMWSKGLKGTSAGRVQSVALKYIADLEKEIGAFTPEEYWKGSIKCEGFSAELASINGKAVSIKNGTKAAALRNDVLSGLSSAKVIDYSKKTRTRSPEPPFITSTIQQAASNQFNWNAQKTMQVAQALFAAGLISYLRTDSTRIEPEKINSLREKIESKIGKEYLSPSPRTWANKDASHDAHEAIRPTYETPLNALSEDEKKLLGLVDKRFKASQMADAVFEQASVKIEIKSGSNTYIFKVNGSIMTFEGFLKILGENKEDLLLPKMAVGDSVPVSDFSVSQHFTQPPGRYSDASLIKKLEKEEVGRPSTYASIIETLIHRGYAIRDKKAIKATELGIMVSDYLSHSFPNLVSPEMTAKMERDLDLIAAGKTDYVKVMKDFYSTLWTSMESAKKFNPKDIFKVDRNCPECSSFLIKKKGDTGIHLGCSSWPKCGFILNINESGEEIVGEEQTGEPCPECGGILKERDGKFGGKWLGCSNYPTCTWKANIDENGNIVEKKKSKITGIKCVKCSQFMRKLTNKKGEVFLGCSGYPNCNMIMNIDSKGRVYYNK